MKHTLERWYFTETNHADDPVTPTSEAELDQVLEEVLAYKQPHRPMLVHRAAPSTVR